jgi:hypothetical protein
MHTRLPIPLLPFLLLGLSACSVQDDPPGARTDSSSPIERDSGAMVDGSMTDSLAAFSLEPEFTALPPHLKMSERVVAFAVELDQANPATARDQNILLAPPPNSTPVSAEELLSVYRTCENAPNRPTLLAQLTGGYKIFQSSYRENMAASLGIVGAGDVSGSRHAMVFQYHFYRVVRGTCTVNGTAVPVIWGVGVASTLHIKEVKGGAKTAALPGVAASVEFGRASASMRMEVAGLVGRKVEEAFPSTQAAFSFDVKGYGDWAVALDKIRVLVSDTSVTATPQLLVTEESLPAIARAMRGRGR